MRRAGLKAGQGWASTNPRRRRWTGQREGKQRGSELPLVSRHGQTGGGIYLWLVRRTGLWRYEGWECECCGRICKRSSWHDPGGSRAGLVGLGMQREEAWVEQASRMRGDGERPGEARGEREASRAEEEQRERAAGISLGRGDKVGSMLDKFSNTEQGNLFCQQSLHA